MGSYAVDTEEAKKQRACMWTLCEKTISPSCLPTPFLDAYTTKSIKWKTTPLLAKSHCFQMSWNPVGVGICGRLLLRWGSCWGRMQFFLCDGGTGVDKAWECQLKADRTTWLSWELLPLVLPLVFCDFLADVLIRKTVFENMLTGP